MENINDNKKAAQLFCDRGFQELRANCEKCFGFCCVALYFSASEGFPEDKAAGKPCINLNSDFRCKVHEKLSKLGLKGCIAYDCFGAGQKVAQKTYEGKDWRKVPQAAKEMYEVFLIVRQINEMLWYLTEALELQMNSEVHEELNIMHSKTKKLTDLSAKALLELDLVAHRTEVNKLLLQTSEKVRNKFCSGKSSLSKRKKILGGGGDFIGADLKKTDLRGGNLRGAYLIAADLRGVDLSGADLIGADLRDADLRGANLSHSIFLTQAQINTAKGDTYTKLPKSLVPPKNWSK